MSPPAETDVLVIGLGPAGAMAARAAAKAGHRVLAVDRKQRAGFPVQCAEFVPAMIGPMFDLDQSAAVTCTRRQSISSMTTFLNDGPPDLKPEFPGHMIDRTEFDASLVAAAAAGGAECRFDVGVRKLDSNGMAHLTDETSLRARVIVGADGPRSCVGRAIGRTNRAIAETRQITVPLLQPFESTDIFLSPAIPGGYAWLFPKADRANLGLGVAPPWRSLLKPTLEQLHRRLVAEGRVGTEVLSHTGGAIPVGGMLDPAAVLGDCLVLLAGDAAGLANPITGAGINSAVVSGRLAGEAAAGWLSGARSAGRDYAGEVEALFGASLERAAGRRRELMRRYAGNSRPDEGELRKSWIAFPEYWAP